MSSVMTQLAVLVGQVDAAVQAQRQAEKRVKDTAAEATRAKEELASATEHVKAQRELLFEAYPELAPVAAQPAVGAEDWQPPGGGMFEPIEVDDPDEIPGFREAPGQRTHEEQ